MANFGDQRYAQQFRDRITRIVKGVLNEERPEPRLGKVYSFNSSENTALVLFAGETVDNLVKVRVALNMQPVTVMSTSFEELGYDAPGDIARVFGKPGSYYILGYYLGGAVWGPIGPEGPQGPEGPGGPIGPQGPTGVTLGSPRRWRSSVSYVTGDTVGYAGKVYVALSNNLNKCPGLTSTVWTPVTGADANAWSDLDPRLGGNSLIAIYETFWGASAVFSTTKTAGEFETGTQALKIVIQGGGNQRIYARDDENIVKGGELIRATVRAKSLVGPMTLQLALIQNDEGGSPEPFQTGVAQTSAIEGAQNISTSGWTTYTFTMKAVNAKPRAKVHFLFGNYGSEERTVLVDLLKIERVTDPLSVARGVAGSRVSPAANTWTVVPLATSVELTSDMTIVSDHLKISTPGLYQFNVRLQTGALTAVRHLWEMTTETATGNAVTDHDNIFRVDEQNSYARTQCMEISVIDRITEAAPFLRVQAYHGAGSQGIEVAKLSAIRIGS